MSKVSKIVRIFNFLIFLLLSKSAFAACTVSPSEIKHPDVLIVVNDNSIDSPLVGDYYCEQRKTDPNNIVHVRVPASYHTSESQFYLLRDQIIKFMQENTIGGITPIQCDTNQGYTRYYCPESILQIRENTNIRYIVTTRGIPTLFDFSSSTFENDQPGENNGFAPIDSYLRGWLANYYSEDQSMLFVDRAIDFKDGRGQRPVNPKIDKEFIIGRIDGLTLEAATNLVDRAIAAEKNGIFGKLIGSKFGPTGDMTDENGATLKQWTGKGLKDYEDIYPSWRYQHGLFGELTGASQAAIRHTKNQECFTYMPVSNERQTKKVPQGCVVKLTSGSVDTFKGSSEAENDLPPGNISGRIPYVDNALVYLGSLDGHQSVGNFGNLLRWAETKDCITLCAEAGNANDIAMCKTASTDLFAEINTDCVKVSEGFIGYNYQSFPLTLLASWPTGWYPGTDEGGVYGDLAISVITNIPYWPPEVRHESEVGFNDDDSLWYRDADAINNDGIIIEKCYVNHQDINEAPTGSCEEPKKVFFNTKTDGLPERFINATPQVVKVSFKFRALGISPGNLDLSLQLLVHEVDDPGPEDNDHDHKASYDKQMAYPEIQAGDTPVDGVSWASAEATFPLDPTKHTRADKLFDGYEIRVEINKRFDGEFAFDHFKIEEDGTDISSFINGDFTGGHKQLSGGDSAVTFLNRLNGVAFWGSTTHHESEGHAFDSHPLETLTYFMRGLPLGEAVWFAQRHNSGMLYGDPVYSPIAVRLNYLNDADFVGGIVALSGSAVNGQDTSLVSTTYSIAYCPGNDFFLCDQNNSWEDLCEQNNSGEDINLCGNGGLENMNFGDWDTTILPLGEYTLRLAVTSDNSTKVQTFYDYYSVTVVNLSDDFDGDGLSNFDEINLHGTNAKKVDTDDDGLSDSDELNNHQTDPLSADTDADGMPDAWEITHGFNPGNTGDTTIDTNDSAIDTDNDGLTNLAEFNHNTDPNNADTDGDMLNDGAEISRGTDPFNVDTDSDGLTDYDEVIIHITDPFDNTDTDSDGMVDEWEIKYETNKTIKDAFVDNDGDGFVNILEYFGAGLPTKADATPAFNTVHVNKENITGIEDGTSEHPFNTMLEGMKLAHPGDTLLVQSGTYSESFSNEGVVPLAIVGIQGSSVTLVDFQIPDSAVWFEMDNITLTDSTDSKLELSNTQGVTFRHCIFDDVKVFGMGNDARFENTIHKGTGSGIGIRVSSGDGGIALVNSTIAGFKWGVRLFSGTVTIKNNILKNDNDLKDVPQSAVSFSMISNGDFAGSNGNITGDPLFVNASSGDYHLHPESPAIDAGDPADLFYNEPENNGDRINMGAYGHSTQASVGSDNDGDSLTNQNESCYDGDCDTYNPYHPITNITGGDLDRDRTDTDGDTYSDSLEIMLGTSPLNSAEIPVRGDLNGDGLVDMADVILGRRIILKLTPPLTGFPFARGDVAPMINGLSSPDGEFNFADVMLIHRRVLGIVNF